MSVPLFIATTAGIICFVVVSAKWIVPAALPGLHDIGFYQTGVEVDTLRVGEGATIAGMTLAEADLRRKHGVTVLAVRRGARVIAAPDGGTDIMAGDVCVVIGPEDQIAAAKWLFRCENQD